MKRSGCVTRNRPSSNTELNVRGSCQVVHPISTRKVDMEMDYYTAVDD